MEKAVIVDALRTPIGRYASALKDVRADDLAALVVAEAVRRNQLDPTTIEDVYFGDANQAGEDNRNVARMAVLLAGLPVEIPAATMNRLCGSGMQAVVAATREIETGNGVCFLAGGVESMTRAPYILEKPQREFARGALTVHDSTIGWRMVNPRLAEKYPPISLGQTAEVVARRYQISREEQDRWALDSHRKALAAQEACYFRNELVPVALAEGATFEKDEGPRRDTTLEKLATLKPAFEKDGTVTAGNSSPLNDGAACLVMMSESHAQRIGAQPIARVLAAASAGVDPSCMGLGPIPASRKALQRAGLKPSELDSIELNEAFASQVIACIRDLELDPARVNPNGGAIALGHPLGASGARLIATLVHDLARRKLRYGLATMCIGVGQGIATVVENLRA
ncbi:MAG TPA: thiolase family protein [Candidatus Dormibacteraeota bacterium]|nr:thiolase family protein [Candidatus Dormibacteraeota bacterium]